jgi:hypothetical protein
MSIVESQNFSHTISESNSKMESRHRYFIKTFADWMKFNQKEACLFKTHATWHKDYATSTINKTSTTPLQHRRTVSPRQHQTKQRPHKHSPHTIVRAMPTPDLASACYLDHDTPIRSRNPHRRGTAKYTKEQISIGTSDYTFAMTANRPKKMLHIYNKLTFTIIIHIMLYTLSTNGITALGL